MFSDRSLQEVMDEIVPKMVPAIVDILEKPGASATGQIKATELLLQVANGPATASPNKVAAVSAAREALPRAIPILEGIVRSHRSVPMRNRATKLILKIKAFLE